MNGRWIGPRALADATGVSTDTLRHYERIGLLPGTVRTAAGYRRYAPATVERVRLIQRALIVGFSLKDLASALGQRERGAPPCRRVRALVGERLAALEVRLEELTRLRDEMHGIVREWDQRLAQTPAGQRARLLDMLAGHPLLERSAKRRSRALPERR
jgi:MerR family transcriptional regulator, Zn(II)-responsive regulator of zntA